MWIPNHKITSLCFKGDLTIEKIQKNENRTLTASTSNAIHRAASSALINEVDQDEENNFRASQFLTFQLFNFA